MDPAAIVTIINFLITKGIPSTIKVLKAWEKIDPTFEDFEKLKGMMKRPEDF